jgi:hypothetical protein
MLCAVWFGTAFDSNPRCGLTVRAIIPWLVVEAALIQAGRLDRPVKKANPTATRRT